MPRNNVTTKPLTRFSARAAEVAVGGGVLFCAALAALHGLEPEFEPSWRFISEYQLGRFGWVMSGAFLALMVSCTALLAAVQSQIRTIGGYIGLLFLVVSAVGFGLAGVFASDSILDTEPTSHGSIHTIAAMLGGNVSGAAYFMDWSLARNMAWKGERRLLLWITGLAILGNLASFWMQAVIVQADAKFGPVVLVGWPNRLLIVAYAAWLIAIAWLVRRKAIGAGS